MNMASSSDFSLSCPIPLQNYPQVLLAHGGGGKLMHQLIEQMFLPIFGRAEVSHDASVFAVPGDRLALTTDSYVVNPLIFPGGDIGSMAVYGTVNDLAMAGAKPLYLSAGFILEEGLSMETLWQIVQSMQGAAQRAGVQIITGDTKVVDRGKGDGMFINTSGVGEIVSPTPISPQQVRSQDAIIINGDLGRHGIAIMAVREGLEFETTIKSDSAPVSHQVLALLEAGVNLHCLRDLTRGGLASTLNEIALSSSLNLHIDESLIPVQEDVRGACEILGFDPLYVANEGRFVAFIPQSDVDLALSVLKETSEAEMTPSVIGTVGEKAISDSSGLVSLKSQIGASRILDWLSGEQLPRIC
nr:hydrogenase expression/formation protein HypE [Roseofilum acuticapitatum]